MNFLYWLAAVPGIGALADVSGDGTVGEVGDCWLTGDALSRLLQPAVAASAMSSKAAGRKRCRDIMAKLL
jgi:hypothetical protein